MLSTRLTSAKIRPIVNFADWILAGMIIAVPDATRERVQACVSRRLAEVEEGRARRDARRQALTEETLAEEGAKRVARVVARVVRKAGILSRSAARKGITARDRHLFDDVLARLVEVGQVSVFETDHGAVLTWN